jgi:hypothetical protein
MFDFTYKTYSRSSAPIPIHINNKAPDSPAFFHPRRSQGTRFDEHGTRLVENADAVAPEGEVLDA